MHKILAAVRTFVLVPLFFLLTCVYALFIIVYGIFRPHTPLFGRIVKRWSRQFLRIPPVRFEIHGVEHVDESRRYVVVSNHLSTFDIPLLFWVLPIEGRFLAKKELFRIPIVSPAMRRIGIIEVDRQAGGSSRQAINDGVRLAAERGYSLMVFPEGTRSGGEELLPFKKGAFRIAIDTGLPILPVAIEGTDRISTPGSKLFFPGHARIRVLPPIETAELTNKDDLTPLMRATEAAITNAYLDLHTSSKP
ncbi:MAG: lysophospholipid acyltransferase family protein [Acidimicrobiia bacterium]